jgi:hypothetical protein
MSSGSSTSPLRSLAQATRRIEELTSVDQLPFLDLQRRAA